MYDFQESWRYLKISVLVILKPRNALYGHRNIPSVDSLIINAQISRIMLTNMSSLSNQFI